MKDPFAIHSVEQTRTTAEAKDRVVAGAYIPRQLAEQVAALSIMLGVPRTRVIELAIIQHLEKHGKDENQIIRAILGRLRAGWESYKLESIGKLNWCESKELEKYKKRIGISITKRGLSRNFINTVKQEIAKWRV
jgi:hypothetical protein